MEKGKRVRISNGSFLNGKEGIIENIDGDKVTVYVDFDIEENKRIRQDFNVEELEEVLSESINKQYKYVAYHGSRDTNLQLKEKFLYLIDDREIASDYARGYNFGYHLFPEETPCIYKMEITFNNPLFINTDEEYDELFDIVNVEDRNTLKILEKNGQDGIILKYDDEDETYFLVVNAKKQCKILEKEIVSKYFGESKKKEKKKDKGKEDKKEEKDYDLSSLNTLKDAFGDDFKYFEKYPYAFNIFVSDKFMDSYKELLNKDLNRDKYLFVRTLDKILSRLDSIGNFNGISTEKINGLANKYAGKIMELKGGKVNGKPLRFLYFKVPNRNLVLGNTIIHKEPNLNASERTSCNSIFDKVFK